MGLGVGIGIGAGPMGRALAVPAGSPFFANNGSTAVWYGWASYPAALYVASTNKTWFAWEAELAGDTRRIEVRVYDHGAGTWGPVYTAGLSPLVNDSHGVPALCGPDANGRIFLYFGSHNSAQKISVTTNANDPSLWTAQTDIVSQAGSLTYPHPVFVGSVMHYFSCAGASQQLVAHQQTTAIDGSGVPTWGASQQLVTWNAVSGICYLSQGFVSGTDVYLLLNFSDNSDVARKNAYVIIYDTTTGNIRNVQNDFSVVPGSQPVDFATCEAHFRAQAFTGSGGNVNSPFALFLDSSSVLNLYYYTDDGNPVRVWHSQFVSGSWTTPVQVVDGLINRRAGLAVAYPNADGTTELLFGKNADGACYHMTRSAGGVWNQPSMVIAQPANNWPWLELAVIPGGHANARAIIGQKGNDDTVEDGTLQAVAFGAPGILKFKYPFGLNFVNFEAANYVSRMTVQPSQVRCQLLDNLFTALKAITAAPQFLMPTMLDVVCLMAAHDSQAALLNILRDRNNMSVGGGAPTFTADRGFTYNGTTDWHDTNFNPVTAFDVLSSQNSHGIWAWIVGTQQTGQCLGWFDGTDGITLGPRLTTDAFLARLAQTSGSGTAGGTVTDGSGLWAANRSGAGSTQFYHNGAAITITSNPNAASVALNSANLNVGRITAAIFAQPSTQVAAWGFARNMTAQNQADLYTALLAYMQGVGVA
jgi:hypothetical protein